MIDEFFETKRNIRKQNDENGNILNWMSSTLLSITICLGMCIYETFNFYYKTIMNREGGCFFVRKIFSWFIASRNNNSTSRIRLIRTEL